MPVLSALVVDDSAVVRSQLRSAVQTIMRDCQLFECEGALEAGRFLMRFVPDVLFLDLNMPQINGIELLNKLDLILAGRRPPIVVSISSDNSAPTLKALKERGTYDLLPKPFDSLSVAKVLLRVIQMARLRRVLVVDDSATVRSVVKRIIERSRFKLSVEEAADGEEALRLFKGQGYDLAFIDVEMPGIDGLDAAGEILYTRNDVHVVLMSGRDDEAIRRAAAHIGVEFFLKKPFYAKDVDAVLHTMYDMADAAFLAAREREVFVDADFGDARSIKVDMTTPL